MLRVKHQGDVNPPAHETRHELDALARRSAASNGFAAAEVALHDIDGEATTHEPRATQRDRAAGPCGAAADPAASSHPRGAASRRPDRAEVPRVVAAMRRSRQGLFAARAVKYLQRAFRRFISSTAIDS